ncbi:putative cyclin-D6-1 isoform X1 [Prosopis cineraria]|uniref:putative cyclin-D6-1 isoform X1 n=1 Tax=Prosopis cineraria TaxID=364024 RepID=UPI002410670F|nr:putative cyclin-D6-1 isoform X1 [Prosopis cineraria]
MAFDLENPFSSFYDLHSDPPTSTLFLVESDHVPPQTYFHTLKSRDFDITVRREVISSISQLSCTCDPLLSYLAVNYVDRFLANRGISQPKSWIHRLLAVSCLSLAAKMMKTEFSVSDIQGEGGIIFERRTVRRMESLILGALQWRMRSITPFSFIPFFIALFRLKDLQLGQVLKDRATEIIIRSQREIRLLEFKPSIVAASALLSASQVLLPLQYPCFLRAISHCAYVNKESILKCNNVIQDITMEGCESAFDLVSSSETPINVLDHHFLSSESEKTNGTTIAASTLRQEKDIKRRKTAGYGNNHGLRISQIEQC